MPDLARTALAIEHHRLSTGRLPETLADLPPPVGVWNYLTDPFTGAVLRYRPDPTWPLGFALYSLGPDGDDDGGGDGGGGGGVGGGGDDIGLMHSFPARHDNAQVQERHGKADGLNVVQGMES